MWRKILLVLIKIWISRRLNKFSVGCFLRTIKAEPVQIEKKNIAYKVIKNKLVFFIWRPQSKRSHDALQAGLNNRKNTLLFFVMLNDKLLDDRMDFVFFSTEDMKTIALEMKVIPYKTWFTNFHEICEFLICI